MASLKTKRIKYSIWHGNWLNRIVGIYGIVGTGNLTFIQVNYPLSVTWHSEILKQFTKNNHTRYPSIVQGSRFVKWGSPGDKETLEDSCPNPVLSRSLGCVAFLSSSYNLK